MESATILCYRRIGHDEENTSAVDEYMSLNSLWR